MKRYLLLLLFIATLQYPAFAQDIRFTTVDPPKDNPWQGILGITQDPQGYLWLAGDGLYKYDGHQYTIYKHNPSNANSLAANRLETVFAGRDGIIWISTYGEGLDRLDPLTNKFTHYSFRIHPRNDPKSVFEDQVTAIIADAEGVLLLGTMHGLIKFNPKTHQIKRFVHNDNDPNSLSSDQVRVLYVDRQGTIWAGCGSPFPGETVIGAGGLNKLDKKTGKFTRYMHDANDPHSLIDNRVRAIFEDSRGTFWVGTAGDGLHTMDRKTGIFQRHLYDPLHPEKLSRPALIGSVATGADHIVFINEDNAGRIWIGTYQNGINVYDPATKKITWYGHTPGNKDNITYNAFWSSYKTRDGIMWISAWGSNALYKINPHQSKLPYHPIGKSVFAFAEDSAKTLWIATQAGLVHEGPGNKMHTFYVDKDTSSLKNDFFNLYKDDDNKLWLVNRFGLVRFDPVSDTFGTYHHETGNINSLLSDTTVAIKQAAPGKLWLGTGKGLDLMDVKTGAFKRFRNNIKDTMVLSPNSAVTFSNKLVTAIETDKNNNAWVGTVSGIDKMNPKTGRFIRVSSHLYVRDLLEDSRGNTWAATASGLFRYDGGAGKFSVFCLGGTDIFGLSEDHQKNLWLNTESGIVKLNLQNNETNTYGINQGVNAASMNFQGYTRQNGEILFGDNYGYFAIQPEKLANRTPATNTVIDRFLLADVPVSPVAGGVLTQPAISTKEIRLKHNQGTFSFGFTNIDFVSNEGDIRGFSMLENYDSKWRKANPDETVNYYNVPPGNYVFKVKSINVDGLVTEKHITIIISPPWWQTWWAYTLFVLAFAGGVWGFIHYRSLALIREKRILEETVQLRTHEVMEQKEELQQQKEVLEEQAREAEIEVALERVRSRSMAMQKSEEMGEVIQTVFEQLLHLGVPADHAGFDMEYDESDDWNLWAADISHSFPTKIHVPYLDHPQFNRVIEARDKGLDFFTSSLTFEEKNRLWDHLFAQAPVPQEIKDAAYRSAGFETSHVLLKHVILNIQNNTNIPFSDGDNAILVRFGKVFEQTYTRFNDLKQAEEQARESQIQLALERVRARTMAMQKSEELAETAGVLFQQLYNLDIVPERVFVGIPIDGTQKIDFWGTEQGGHSISTRFEVDSDDTSVFSRLFKAWKDKKPECAVFLKGKDLDEHINYIANIVYIPVRVELVQEQRIIYTANFSRGILLIVTPEVQSEETQNILQRFAAVFDQTYTRFLDLKKAEAQARESQIQLALERVRARTMAMQHSGELSETASLLFNQVSDLGVQAFATGFNIWNEDNTSFTGYTTDTLGGITVPYIIPVTEDPFFIKINEAKESGESFLVFDSEGESLAQTNRYIETLPVIGDMLIAGKESGIPRPTFQVTHCAFFTGGCLMFITFEPCPAAWDIFKRFAKVFEQTYTRFLDLQRAEVQTREAKIEASLERVRAKAMAMHSSADLAETIKVFYQELGALSVTPRRCGLGLVDKETHISKMSTMNTTEKGGSIEVVGELKLTGHPILEAIYENWLLQKEYHPVLQGNEIKKYYQFLRPQITYPDYSNDAVEYGYFFNFPEGGVFAWTVTELPEEELKVYRRFTSVISLTYKRYNDLQKAESQAREAVRQASVDRVRGEIASMRTTTDLGRIIPLIWNELTILGIPFIRCGVFIVDEGAELIHTHLSTPDGKALAAFDLPFDAEGIGREVLPAWRKNQMAAIHWSAKEFAANTKILVSQGAVKSRGKYVTERPNTTLDLYFFPFLQGMLYAGNTAPLTADEKDLVQSLAEAFSTAYARYEDFNKLEAAKQQVDKTLTELKAAQTQLIQTEKMASLGELTAGIAHEIQNPLNFVNNFSEVNAELIDEMQDEIEKGNLAEIKAIAIDIRENEKKINLHGKRADSIVKGMLQHSQSGSGAKELININALADEYMRLAYHGLRAKDKSFNAEMETHFDPGLPKIKVIGQDIGRVLLNLFNNAFYAVNQKKKTDVPDYKPEIMATTATENGHVIIKVKDNGIGIPDAIKEKIMQPFFTTKPTGEGTGLGLSLTYDMVVKGHGGSIQVNSVEGEGSEFIISLPVS